MSDQQRRGERGNASPQASPTTPRDGDAATNDEITVLAQGSHGAVEETFVAVVRDAETYAALRELESNLPEKTAEFFQSNTVIAAFLGTRNTGGYSVQVARGGEGVFRISESRPARDQIRTQVITTPFQIVAAPTTPERSVQLEFPEAWRNGASRYRVTSGNFTMSGGIAGRAEEFQLEGEMRVVNSGRLATVIFDLRASNGTRALRTAATGIAQPGQITIARMDAGTLIDPPHNGLRATGRYTNEISNLSIAFSSLPSNIADGFTGQGSVASEVVAGSATR